MLKPSKAKETYPPNLFIQKLTCEMAYLEPQQPKSTLTVYTATFLSADLDLPRVMAMHIFAVDSEDVDLYDCLPPEKGGVGKKIAWTVGHLAGYPAATGAKLRRVGTAQTPASEPPMVVQQLRPGKR
jgi:hypothetical protein